MITKFKYKPNNGYSLHDMVVSDIAIDDDVIKLTFEEGYVSTKEPYEKTPGNIYIQGVDIDFVTVKVFDKVKSSGSFRGREMSLAEFLNRYSKGFTFEIVDELYGYNQVCYDGYLRVEGKSTMTEMTMAIYHFGDIVYEVVG